MDHERETDYLQHFVQQNLRYVTLVQTSAESSHVPTLNLVLVAVKSCATVRRHCDCFSESGAVYKYPDLLTYYEYDVRLSVCPAVRL